MDKYKAVSILNIVQLILILGIITLACIFNNYWLLFLLFATDCSNSEKRLLGIKD